MLKTEFEIIENFFATSDLDFEQKGVDLGIGDDAALIRVPDGHNLSISTDILVEGRHFPIDAEADQIAKRALSVNLSDLAAMAAKPFCFTLGLVLPEPTEAWLSKFSAGLGEIARKFQIRLVGGDLSEGPMTIAIQVHGINPIGAALRRDGAKIGDQVFVTGSLGDGAIGLMCLEGKSHLGSSFQLASDPSRPCLDYFEKAYYQPTPRIDFSIHCRDYITSAIDISDGLRGDLQHMVKASGVGARLDIESIPVSEFAKRCLNLENLYKAALFGGDDYELCITVSKDRCAEFVAAAGQIETKVTCIGEIIEGEGVELTSPGGEAKPIDGESYLHFSDLQS